MAARCAYKGSRCQEEKVQTDRYKQLLLKQRDIMIQLTARLNERDQSVSSSWLARKASTG